MNLFDRFAERARIQPGHPALLGPRPGECWTYARLHEAVEEEAAILRAAGCGPGSSLGLHCRSGRDYIVYTYAAWRNRSCVVPIPVELAGDEKRAIATEIHLDFILGRTSDGELFQDVCQRPPTALSGGQVLFTGLPRRAHPAALAGLDPAFIRFTSGTTGTCKGVILSHRTIEERIGAANEVLNISSRDRVLWLLSMSYHFAVSIVSYLSQGAGIILCPNHLSETMVAAAARERATVIYGSPLHYDFLAGEGSGRQLPELRLALSTTTALKSGIALRFQERFGVPLGQAYGIIEVGLPFIRLGEMDAPPDSVGRLLPAYEVRLQRDPAYGKDGECGEDGEILLRGPGLFDAYYEPFRERAQVLENGWFHTGDLGRLDPQGWLRITGRSKEMISSGGMKFFPQEVEAVLEAHPAVERAVVHGHRQEPLGEVARAEVVLRVGEGIGAAATELRSWCRERLAPYKVPEEIFLVRAIRTNAAGKPLRREAPEVAKGAER